MLRRFILCLLVALTGTTIAGSAEARRRQPIDATPFSHAPCSVLDRPAHARRHSAACSITGLAFPRSTIRLARTCNSRSKACRQATTMLQNTRSPTTISIPSATCSPRCGPAGRRHRPDIARRGMQMSVRFSFKRSGEIIGAPRVTYATAGVACGCSQLPISSRSTPRSKACVPLKFTGGLGGALAGRPIAIRYVDNRDLGRASGTP